MFEDKQIKEKSYMPAYDESNMYDEVVGHYYDSLPPNKVECVKQFNFKIRCISQMYIKGLNYIFS